MGKTGFLYNSFASRLKYEPSPCQQKLLEKVAEFISSDEGDILVVNGYAGTGKTTAIAAVIEAMREYKAKTVLLAPTGRSAKVLSSYGGQHAYTIHKHIYRQQSVGGDGFGQFSLSFNKDKNTLFIVDEVSLIGVDAGQQSTASFGSGNLLDDLITFVRSGVECRLILIGDAAQLPPIGLDRSPALSKDYMNSKGGVSYVELTTVVRQEQDSGILYNATLIRKNIVEMDVYSIPTMDLKDLSLETDDYDDVERITGGELIEKISDAYSEYGEDETIILCRSNKRAIKYNAGVRGTVQYKEDALVRDDKLMIVKNCYQFVDQMEDVNYIANGDIAKLLKIYEYEERYGLNFAQARLSFPDYDNQEITATVILDTLSSESPALTYEQQNMLYNGVNADYEHIKSKKKRYEAIREDNYFNALQLKYANAITGHKSQGGQWSCVFIDNPFWQDEVTIDDLKWLYTAITRAVHKVYLVNFKDK